MRTTAFVTTIKSLAAGEAAEPQEVAEPRVAAVVLLLGTTLALMLFPALVAVLAMLN